MGSIIKGKVNKKADFLNKQSKHQLDSADTGDYVRFSENTSILVNYYKQNEVLTTTDKGMGNVETNIGLSGKKFNIIKDVPMFGVNTSQFELDDGEFGISGALKSEGVLIPDTVIPTADDYITFGFQNHKYLFKITGIESDTIRSNHYFKVSFKYDRDDVDSIKAQVVNEYTCIFDNIGSEDKCILLDSKLEQLQKLNDIYNSITESYMATFYNQMCSTLTHTWIDRLIYDPYMIEFIKRHKLFFFEYDYTSYTFDHILDTPSDFIMRYNRTIYNTIDKGGDFEYKVRQIIINDPLTYFYNSPDNYFTLEMYDGNYNDLLYCNKFTSFVKGEESDNILFNILDSYMENGITTELYDKVLSSFDSFYCEDNRDYFVVCPLILFIIKKLVDNITLKKIKEVF